KLKSSRTRQFPNFSFSALGAQQLRAFDFTLEKGVLGNCTNVGPLPAEDVHLKTPLEPTGYLTAKVTQPLSGLIRIRRGLESLKVGEDLATEQARADRQKLVRDVKQVYYSLQQTASTVRSVRQTTELYQEFARVTENYVAGQVALKADFLEVQAR